jgi:hypothetical protein
MAPCRGFWGADVTAVQLFMHFLYGLQHAGTCTAYRSNIIGGGEGGGVPVVNVPVYMGGCVQAFLLVVQHYAAYFSFGG